MTRNNLCEVFGEATHKQMHKGYTDFDCPFCHVPVDRGEVWLKREEVWLAWVECALCAMADAKHPALQTARAEAMAAFVRAVPATGPIGRAKGFYKREQLT